MIYLIDYENVREHGLKNITYKKDDMIYLFYTENAAKIELDALSEIEAAMKFIKVAAGKQSLDMHLISYLGYLICEKGNNTEFVIVSNDTGYDGVLRFWQGKGYKTSRRLVNTAQKTGSSGNRSSRGTRARTRSGVRKTVEVIQTLEPAAPPADALQETTEPITVQTEEAVVTAAAEQTAPETTEMVKTEEAAEQKPAKRSRRGRRKKTEAAETVQTETEVREEAPETEKQTGAEEEAAAAEEKTEAAEEVKQAPEPAMLPAVPAGKITMQIIPVRVVENAIPVKPAEENKPAAEKEKTEETEEKTVEEKTEAAPETAVSEEETTAESASEEKAEAEAAEEKQEEAEAQPVKEKRTRTRRSGRRSSKKAAAEKAAEEQDAAPAIAEEEQQEQLQKTEEVRPAAEENAAPAEVSQSQPESTQLNNKIMSLYSKAGIDHKVAGQIASLVVKNMNEDNRKAVIYRKIVKQFGQKQGLAYYTVIKKDI